MERKRIRVSISDKGDVSWSRGGEGVSVREFVDNYPCKALGYLASGGRSNQLGVAVLSSIGGLGKLQEFNREHMCGAEDNLIQQI